MNPAHIERLKEEHKKGLLICEEKIKHWEKFKCDYEALKQQLQTLPDALSYDITVPFGPNAFTLGKLVHTNEVMVLLGDNWFAEVSAKQAADIANRRIAQCTKMLEDLTKEKQQFIDWLNYIDEVHNEELVEIYEEYDEEKEKEWREQHSKNVKAYRQKLSEETKQAHSNEENPNFDDDIATKLEDLELLESTEDRESEANNSEASELKGSFESEIVALEVEECKTSDSEAKSNKVTLKLNINSNNIQNSIQETDSGDEDDDGSKSDDINANQENCIAGSNGKHVRWQDLSKQNIKKITFKHSRSKHHGHSKHHIKRQDSSESDEPQPLIQSPSDIYKHFGSFFQASSPKSILKVKNSPTTPDGNGSFFSEEESVPKDNSPDLRTENIVDAFTGKIYECSSPICIPEKKTSSSRPTSHFKNSRKNRKR